MGNDNFIGIDANIAMKLVGNYAQNHLNVINGNANLTSIRQTGTISDSRAVWFSLDTLNSFISTIQNMAASKCSVINGSLGIRIYFGEYPAADSALWGTPALPVGPPQLLERYAGMHTLVMVPTYNNGSVNMDFDPNFVNPGGTPMPMSAVCLIPGGINTTPLTMQNHGSLSPPPFELAGQYGAATGAAFLDVVDES